LADSETRHIMKNVADSLEVLLPLSLDGDKFLSQANRETVDRNLAKLANSADALAEHGTSGSLDFELLAAAFARAAGRLRQDVREMQPSEARHILVDLTQHCVGCHSRDTARRDFPLSTALNKYLQDQPLDEAERARLQVALRQFQGALETWETVLSDPTIQPVDMAVDGDFVEYLTVAVRVEKAYQRAAEHLEKVSAREDTPFYLRRRLQTWVSDLKSLEHDKNRRLSMADARKAFLRPDTRPGLLWNDSGLVSDLALSASLRQLVASTDTDVTPEQLAEAYYMLGVLEARTTGLYSALPNMERFWEAAIRTAPNSPYAVEAYALLEEYAATTFSGELPFERTDETFARLAELRSLIGIKR
jgi:hypothetical protein